MFQNVCRLIKPRTARWLHTSYRLSNVIGSQVKFHPEKYEEFKGKDLVDPKILSSLHKNKFIDLTPIQKQALVPIMNVENGIVCRAKTGTGKTLTFIIPTLNEILKSNKTKQVDTLVIVPTRDLAFQIYDEYNKIIQNLPGKPGFKPRMGMVIGGSRNIFDSRRPPQIVIATPGRLEADLQSKRDFARCFQNLTYRVFDEADRLLDIGFEPSLNTINDLLYEGRANPNSIKSLLFSATVDDKITRFSKNNIGEDYTYINTVSDSEPEVHENVKQILYKCEDQVDKLNTFLTYFFNTMKQENKFKIMIFVPTKSSVDWLNDYLNQILKSDELDVESKFDLFQLSGNLTAAARTRNLARFKRSNKGVLITTDVAARGIDVKGVTHVLQPFPSTDIADYVHKVGRTGRAGEKGEAILFLGDAEMRFAKLLKRYRGVEFAETHESREIEKTNFVGIVKSDEELTEDFIIRFFGYITQLKAIRAIDIDQFIEETCELYRSMMQNPELRISQGALNHMPDVASYIRREFFKGNFNKPRPSYDNDRRGTSYQRGRDFRSNNRSDYRSDFRGGSRADKRTFSNKNYSRKRNYDDE